MDWIKELREKNNLSMEKAAQASGVHKGTINNVEKGRGDPGWKTILRLLKAYNYSVYIANNTTGTLITSEGKQDLTTEITIGKIKAINKEE